MIKTFLTLIFYCTFSAGYTQTLPSWKATDLKQYVNDSGGAKVKVINIWATFCKPCIAEIPYFIKVAGDFGNAVELMLVSVDMKSHYPDKIVQFAAAHNLRAKIAWLNETNADYFCPMLHEKWSGSIPATLIINTSTGYRKFFEEEMSASMLEKEIRAALK